MRKKTGSASVTNKIIAKPSRSKSTTVQVSGRNNSTAPTVENVHIMDSTDVSINHTDGVDEDSISHGSSRDRSPTPLESDLLRYLTAHITPIDKHKNSHLYVDMTSFVIGRDEYLQGIVRLVQSDCPEVSDDLKCFVDAMKQAFVAVKACGTN